MLKVPIAPELQDVFYKQEVQSFLESFVVPADESGKAVGGAPTSVQQVIDDVAEIWKEKGFLHPAELRQELVQKYMSNIDPKLLEIMDDVERSRYIPDAMTGFIQKEHLGNISGLGHLYSQLTGQPATMIEVDYSNMGGTNKHYQRELLKNSDSPHAEKALELLEMSIEKPKELAKAMANASGDVVELFKKTQDLSFKMTDDAARLVAQTIQSELQRTLPEGAKILPVRAGGDELRLIVTGLDPDQYSDVTRQVHEAIEVHMAKLNLHDHVHLKGPNEATKNGFGAAVSMLDMRELNPATAVHDADLEIKRAKHAIGLDRLGEIEESLLRKELTKYYKENPAELPKNMSRKEVVNFIVDEVKAEAEAKYEKFKDLKAEGVQTPDETNQYTQQQRRDMAINSMKENGATDPGFLVVEDKGDHLFETPAQRRAQAVLQRVEELGVKIDNPAQIEYLNRIVSSTTPVDPSSGAWMDRDLPAQLEIYSNDTPELREILIEQGVSREVADNITPQSMRVSFHNLGGLNELLGHDGANAILREMHSSIIVEALQEQGINPSDFRVAHYGGAEFQVITPPAVKGADGEYKIIDQDVMKNVEKAVADKTAALNDVNVAKFLRDNGLELAPKEMSKLENMTLGQTKDIKKDRAISGMHVVTHSQSVELGEERAGRFLFLQKEMLETRVDEFRASMKLSGMAGMINKAQGALDMIKTSKGAKAAGVGIVLTGAVAGAIHLMKEAQDDMAEKFYNEGKFSSDPSVNQAAYDEYIVLNETISNLMQAENIAGQGLFVFLTTPALEATAAAMFESYASKYNIKGEVYDALSKSMLDNMSARSEFIGGLRDDLDKIENMPPELERLALMKTNLEQAEDELKRVSGWRPSQYRREQRLPLDRRAELNEARELRIEGRTDDLNDAKAAFEVELATLLQDPDMAPMLLQNLSDNTIADYMERLVKFADPEQVDPLIKELVDVRAKQDLYHTSMVMSKSDGTGAVEDFLDAVAEFAEVMEKLKENPEIIRGFIADVCAPVDKETLEAAIEKRLTREIDPELVEHYAKKAAELLKGDLKGNFGDKAAPEIPKLENPAVDLSNDVGATAVFQGKKL
tara:strand:- start:663 stop:3950 length:3288 start_codon:yes stop_codon:yes gene_type:complete